MRVVSRILSTLILVACITLIAVLPLSLQLLLEESEQLLLSRAESTPLLIGAKGSALDLAMNSLYFGDEVPELINMQASQQVMESDLAVPIPMYVRFRARSFPIIGTTLDYFDFRELHIEQGRMLAMLGECVLGAGVAQRLKLKPGDSLVSSPENLFDLAGIYPLKMKVAGVLKPSHTADDMAVFVDLKTAWVIQGLGHGHEDLAKTQDATVILSRTESNVTVNAKLMQFTEISEANLELFRRVAKLRGGVAVAEAKDAQCQLCHVVLRPQMFVDVKLNDQIVQCPSCSRVLYYEPPPPEEPPPGP